jgi:hypothetical protein
MANKNQNSSMTELEKVEKEFLAEIEKRGIVHVFEWMHSWFGNVAQASIKDEMKGYLGVHAKDPDAINLYLLDRMMSMAKQVSNKSTSSSANLMNEARVSVMASMIEENHNGYGSRYVRSQTWERWQENPETQRRIESERQRLESTQPEDADSQSSESRSRPRG